MQEFPSSHIELTQNYIKEIINQHVLESDISPHPKGILWVVEYLQRIKIQLQNMALRSKCVLCDWLETAMHKALTKLSKLESAEVAILTLINLRVYATAKGNQILLSESGTAGFNAT